MSPRHSDSDGDCPVGLVCIASERRCLAPTEACIEKRDAVYALAAPGSSCSLSAEEDGICIGAACQPSFCGDGFVDPPAARRVTATNTAHILVR